MKVDYAWETFMKISSVLASDPRDIRQRLGKALDEHFSACLIQDQIPHQLLPDFQELLDSIDKLEPYSDQCLQMSQKRASEVAEIIFYLYTGLSKYHYNKD